jgi:hypothetical protein
LLAEEEERLLQEELAREQAEGGHSDHESPQETPRSEPEAEPEEPEEEVAEDQKSTTSADSFNPDDVDLD